MNAAICIRSARCSTRCAPAAARRARRGSATPTRRDSPRSSTRRSSRSRTAVSTRVGAADRPAASPARRAGALDRRWRRFAAAAVLCLTAGAAGVGYFAAHSGGDAGVAPSSRKSVAVLPFKPLAGQASEDIVLGLGLSEALIAELGAFKTISVRPLSASGRYGPERDPLAAGRELRADLVVDGAIQRAEGRLRVNVSLVRVSDGAAVWTDRFDTAWTDVFRVQDVIAEQVGRALSAALSDEGRERVSRRRTENTAAYEAYLKGRYFWNMRTSDGLKKRSATSSRRSTGTARMRGLCRPGGYLRHARVRCRMRPCRRRKRARKPSGRQSGAALDDSLAEAHVRWRLSPTPSTGTGRRASASSSARSSSTRPTRPRTSGTRSIWGSSVASTKPSLTRSAGATSSRCRW